MIREIVLQQNAFHPVDTYCPMKRQYAVLKTISRFAEMSKRAVENEVLVESIANMPLRTRFGQLAVPVLALSKGSVTVNGNPLDAV